MGKTRIPETLTADEQGRLERHLRKKNGSAGLRNLVMVHLMVNAGLRAGEVRGLRWANLDAESGRLKIRGKGNRERIIWLGKADVALLLAWRAAQPPSSKPPSSNLVFTSLADGNRPVCGRWLRGFINRIAARSGIFKPVHCHTLRHTFATDLYRQTKNLRLVQKALGHASINTTTIYTHITDEELEMAMKELRQ
jgi:integrase/recombinase XerD